MIVLAGGWAYAGVALGGGSVVQAVFVVLVAPEVEQGSLTPALITVPVLMWWQPPRSCSAASCAGALSSRTNLAMPDTGRRF